MAKKDLNNDLFAGGSISDEEKETKKAKKPKKAKPSNSKNKKGLAANQIKIIRNVVCVVLVVALLATYIATGAVRKGFVHGVLQWTTALPAVTVKSDEGEKITVPVSTYNYYFAMLYNNMKHTQEAYEASGLGAILGLDVDFDQPFSKQHTTNDDGDKVTWDEKMKEQVLDQILETYSLYLEAVKENGGEEPEITSAQEKEIEEAIESYREAATSYGYTLSAYLVAAMGKGVTEKVFRREMVRAHIAENYEESIKGETVEVERTEDDYIEYRDKHTDDLEVVDVRIFEAASEEDAEEFKAALNEDASNFTELAVQYSESDYDKMYFADDSASTYLKATRGSLYSYAIAKADDGDYLGLDWLFSSKREAGDAYVYDTTVVYVLSPAKLAETNTINIRHILVRPETKDDKTAITDATAEQWAAALAKANSILDEFNLGAKTAEDFGKLAEKYSVDDGSKNNGGLYEDVYPGQMIQKFHNWCFDDSRAVGDTAIVQTQAGYHIMFFDGATDSPIWKTLVKNELPTEVKLQEHIVDTYTVKANWFGSRYFEKDVDIDR